MFFMGKAVVWMVWGCQKHHEATFSMSYLPSGKRVHSYGKSPCSLVNQLFLWGVFHSELFVYQRVTAGQGLDTIQWLETMNGGTPIYHSFLLDFPFINQSVISSKDFCAKSNSTFRWTPGKLPGWSARSAKGAAEIRPWVQGTLPAWWNTRWM